MIRINSSNVCHIPLLSFIYKTSKFNEVAINGFRGFRFLCITNDKLCKLSLSSEFYYTDVLIDAVAEISPQKIAAISQNAGFIGIIDRKY